MVKHHDSKCSSLALAPFQKLLYFGLIERKTVGFTKDKFSGSGLEKEKERKKKGPKVTGKLYFQTTGILNSHPVYSEMSAMVLTFWTITSI